MSRNRRVLLASFLILLIVFAVGVVQLFVLRFKRGDVYPAYSTLRADPLGAKALYESLEVLPNIRAVRNYRTTTKVADALEGTWFYLGLRSENIRLFDKKTMDGFEEIANRGGRLFISFAPEEKEPKKKKKVEGADGEGTQESDQGKDFAESNGKDGAAGEDGTWRSRGLVAMTDRWGFAIDNARLRNSSMEHSSATLTEDNQHLLPGSIRWLTTLIFDELDEAWRVIYLRGGHAVLMERPWGKGTIVLSADSYFISNEALMTHRYPELLSWLLSDNKTAVFDETHFGVTENIGVAALGRKYRLHGLFFGFLVLAALYVWKNASGFVPVHFSGDGGLSHGDDMLVEGKDASAGFINLLRRAVASKDILAVCFQEWKKALPSYQRHSRKRLERMEAVLQREKIQTGRHRDPVRAYQSMIEIWTEGKF